MTIACRTGCGEQIENDFHYFPDGFIYFLPKNQDGTIHNCKNLTQYGDESWSKGELDSNIELHDILYTNPFEIHYGYKNSMTELVKLTNNNEKKLAAMMNEVKILDEKLRKKDVNKKLKNFKPGKNMLRNEYFLIANRFGDKKNKLTAETDLNIFLKSLQTQCILFPTPFIDNPNRLGISDIMILYQTYKILSNYECALKAILIQNYISHDQDDEIMELYEKINSKKELEIKDEVKKTAVYIRNNYFRKIEKLIKSFIRQNYSLVSLKSHYSKYVISAEKTMKIDSNLVSRENDDLFEFLTFGQIVRILRKNKEKFVQPFTEIEWSVLDKLSYIVDRRNEWEHLSDDLEKNVKEKAKLISYWFSMDVIGFFENLKLK
jgi:hypothetical protein